MSGTSQIPVVLDYLVALFSGDSGMAAITFADETGVTVYDGTPPSALYPKLALYVGVDDPDSDDQTGGDGEQEWAALGAMARDELLTIWCAAEAWWGDSEDVATPRRAAFAIVARVETLTKADATLGGTVLFTAPGVTGARLRQTWADSGCRARVVFRIDAKVRLR